MFLVLWGWVGGRGTGKNKFQKSAPIHSGAGEKETLNINVGGKMFAPQHNKYINSGERLNMKERWALMNKTDGPEGFVG